jgi:hypothetical protein
VILNCAPRDADTLYFCIGDINDPKVKAGKEGAFEKSVAFFKRHL